MKSNPDTLTVELRPVAMRMAAALLSEHPNLVSPALVRILRRNGERGSDRVRVKLHNRAEAERFVHCVAMAAEKINPRLLVDVVPGGLAPLPRGRLEGPPPNLPRVEEEPPESGPAAMVEIARDIKGALGGAGRPLKVDPLVAHETLEAIRRNHVRTRGGRQDSPMQKAEWMLRASAASIERALPIGRDIDAEIRKAVADLPKGATPLFVLVDYSRAGKKRD